MVSLPELAFLVLSDVINIITRVRFNITWFIIVCLPCSGNTMSWKTREICKPLLITLPPSPHPPVNKKTSAYTPPLARIEIFVILYQFRFLGNCPPTLPLGQH